MDYFKRVNDTYGHAAGDDVLRGVADCLRQNLGKNEIGCRYGCEEFLVMLRNTRGEEAEKFAERLRKSIHERQFALGKEKYPYTGTASFGVSTLDADETLDDLIQRADKALYEAKHRGRNCVFRVS